MSSKLPVFCFTPFFFKRVLCFLLYILCKVVLLRSNSSEGGLVGLVPLHVTCCNWKLFETEIQDLPNLRESFFYWKELKGLSINYAAKQCVVPPPPPHLFPYGVNEGEPLIKIKGVRGGLVRNMRTPVPIIVNSSRRLLYFL